MWTHIIYQQYGINCQQIPHQSVLLFQSGPRQLMLVPKAHFYNQDIEALANINQRVNKSYNESIPQIISTRNGKHTISFNCGAWVLLKMPGKERFDSNKPLGEQLALFHQTGQTVNNRINQTKSKQKQEINYLRWPEYWGERVDALHDARDQLLQKDQLSPIEELVLDEMPFVLGLAENAISYAVNVRMDQYIKEFPVICRYRFYETESGIPMNSPVYWVIDHPARDLAEWVRHKAWFQEDPFDDIDAFLNDYESVKKMEPSMWAMLYARLLFPLSGIEMIEHCLGGTLDRDDGRQQQRKAALKQQLNDRLDQYELFLKEFSERYKENLEAVEWLTG